MKWRAPLGRDRLWINLLVILLSVSSSPAEEKIVIGASGCKFAICSAANAFHGKIFALATARLPF